MATMITQPSSMLSLPIHEEESNFGVEVVEGIDGPKDATPSMFERIRKIGAGDVGRVYIVRDRQTRELYAMKILSKEEMVKRNKIQRCLTERQVLAAVDHPCIVSLHFSFKTELFLYFVMDYCAGGEFFRMLRKQPMQRIPEEWVKFYAAEVLMALQYLHSLGFVYRDLKPENILLHASGHIMLTDFDLAVKAEPGTASVVKRSIGSRIKHAFSSKEDHSEGMIFHSSEPTLSRMSFVGTCEYLSPEIVTGQGHTSAVDWWTFGVLLFEMTYGRTPFAAKSEEATFAKIANKDEKLHFPESPEISKELKKLIKGLLKKAVKKRLGSKFGASDIMKSDFFTGVKLQLIRNQKPPYIPPLAHDLDDTAFEHVKERDIDPELDAECPWLGDPIPLSRRASQQSIIDPQDQALLIAQAMPAFAGAAGVGGDRARFLSFNPPTSSSGGAPARERFGSQTESASRPRINSASGASGGADPFAGFDEATQYHHRHPPTSRPSSLALTTPPLVIPTTVASPVPPDLDISELSRKLSRQASAGSGIEGASPRVSGAKPKRTPVTFKVFVPQMVFPSQEFFLTLIAEKDGETTEPMTETAGSVVTGSCGPYLLARNKQIDVSVSLSSDFTILCETHEKIVWTGTGHSKVNFWVRSPPVFGRFTGRMQIAYADQTHTLGFNINIGE